jgi:hypothetical protein
MSRHAITQPVAFPDLGHFFYWPEQPNRRALVCFHILYNPTRQQKFHFFIKSWSVVHSGTNIISLWIKARAG